MAVVSPSHLHLFTAPSPTTILISYQCPSLQLLLNRLESSKSVCEIKQIHALIIKANNNTVSITPNPIHELLSTKLTSLLLHHNITTPQNLSYACSLANLSHQNPVSIFNALIQSLSLSNATFPQIFALFRHLLLFGLSPDTYTLPYLLQACSRCRAFSQGLQIHAHSIKTGLSSNLFVNNTLMRLYAVCGFIHAVLNLFDRAPHRDLISWTTLIQAYAKMGYPSLAIRAFFLMDLTADRMTLAVVFSACSQLADFALGNKIRSYMYSHHIDLHSDVFLCNALLDMYLKCGHPDLARQLFREMPVKNIVSWNSMILGLAHQGLFKEALHMFRTMQSVGLNPDPVTLVGVLNSSANLGQLHLGKWVHSFMDKNHIKADGHVGNALVDMYAKCGSIDQAYRVFRTMKCRDVYSYTAMIVGFAMHGKADRALAIFSEMPRMGIQPDQVTFVGVLSACSHAGLVEEGKRYFEDMSSLYHLEPQTEHYGCMVDLLGRAGLLSEAQEFINKMPILPDASVWGSLLGACKIHAKVEIGESVIHKLVEMEPERDGAYILMSNLYSSANRWGDALKWRKVMKQKHMKKTPGCSSIEVEGMVHEFRKAEKSHPKSKELHNLLEGMAKHLRNYGFDDGI